jgi:hypothetical protein
MASLVYTVVSFNLPLYLSKTTCINDELRTLLHSLEYETHRVIARRARHNFVESIHLVNISQDHLCQKHGSGGRIAGRSGTALAGTKISTIWRHILV